jgi:hypothetical protein
VVEKGQESVSLSPVVFPADYISQGFRFLYTRQLAFDGNFSALHDRQKRPEDDVFLADGTSFMTERTAYQEHLKVALETKEVSYHI